MTPPRRTAPATRLPGSVQCRVLSVAMACACLASACDRDSAPLPSAPDKNRLIRIAVLAEGKDDPTWPVVVMTARRFADRNPRVLTEVVAPEVVSPSRQQAMLAEFTSARCDILCVAPTDPAAIRAAIDERARAGIQVVVFGRDVEGSDRAAYAGPWEEAIGQAAADACRSHVSELSQSIIAVAPEGTTTAARERALRDRLAHGGAGELIRTLRVTGAPFESARAVRNEARRYPRTACWVLLDDWPLRAEAAEPARLVPEASALIVCNGSRRHLDRLRTGEIAALIAFDYQAAAESALRAAMDIANQPQRKGVGRDVPVEIVTSDNAQAYARRWVLWERGEPTPPPGN